MNQLFTIYNVDIHDMPNLDHKILHFHNDHDNQYPGVSHNEDEQCHFWYKLADNNFGTVCKV